MKPPPRPTCRCCACLGAWRKMALPCNCNLNLSPILLEQLAHPVFVAEFPKYLSARSSPRARMRLLPPVRRAHLPRRRASGIASLLRRWKISTPSTANIIGASNTSPDAGMIEIITCCATHGYLPLLGTDESVRAQVRTAVQTHIRHIGKHPRGIWAPECGYRPAGFWNYPVLRELDRVAGRDSSASASSRRSRSPARLLLCRHSPGGESERIPLPMSLLNRLPHDPQLEQAR
jgi:1,4-alpha-glucan branching enzyme